MFGTPLLMMGLGTFDGYGSLMLAGYSMVLLWPTFLVSGGQGSGLGLIATMILAAILQLLFERRIQQEEQAQTNSRNR